MSEFLPDGPRSVVAVEPVVDDVRTAVRRALDAADWRRAVPRGADVALKVNLGWDLFIPGSITSPLVAESLILELREHVGAIYMVEADQVLEDVESAFQRSGMAAVCRRTGVEWVNMEHSPTVTVAMPGNVVLKEVQVPRILRDTVLISVPVMKTHARTVITGALKNQWGCLHKMRHEYHLVLDDALSDLNQVVRPALSVMDGTVGLEGNGPKSGRPRLADRILCSSDPVALDTVQAICMGIDPAAVPHLQRCAERGIGVTDRARIEVRGTGARGVGRAVSAGPPQHRLAGREPAAPLRAEAARLRHAVLSGLSAGRQGLLPALGGEIRQGVLAPYPRSRGVRPAVDRRLDRRPRSPPATSPHLMPTPRVVVLGGGLSGMAAAYTAARAGWERVTIVERGPELGGLAGTFEAGGRFYPLAYHHILHRDQGLLYFLDHIGAAARVRWRKIKLLFRLDGRLYDLAHPVDFLRFPMSVADKLRFVRLMVRCFGKSDWSDWHARSAADLIDAWGGPGVRRAIFDPLTRLKFDRPCDEVSGAWLGARLYFREGSAPLGYIPGCNWTKVLCDGVTRLLTRRSVDVRLGASAARLIRTGDRVTAVELDDGARLTADLVVSTVPAEVYQRLLGVARPDLEAIRYTAVVSAMFATRQRITPEFYWMNLASPRLPGVRHLHAERAQSHNRGAGGHLSQYHEPSAEPPRCLLRAERRGDPGCVSRRFPAGLRFRSRAVLGAGSTVCRCTRPCSGPATATRPSETRPAATCIWPATTGRFRQSRRPVQRCGPGSRRAPRCWPTTAAGPICRRRSTASV